MDILIEIVIYSLIVYRFAVDISELDGPFNVYWRIREFTYHDAIPAWVHNGIRCAMCVSFWLTGMVVLYKWDIRFLACAGVVTLIVKYMNRGE